jgi:hypothetical protein
MRQNPNPLKFDMEIAPGVKAANDLEGPDVMVPFCKAHRSWPCRYCGTAHFEGCDCPVCVEPKDDPLAEVKEAAAYAASMIAGMELHWRKSRETQIADELARYVRVLRDFSKT